MFGTFVIYFQSTNILTTFPSIEYIKDHLLCVMVFFPAILSCPIYPTRNHPFPLARLTFSVFLNTFGHEFQSKNSTLLGWTDPVDGIID